VHWRRQRAGAAILAHGARSIHNQSARFSIESYKLLWTHFPMFSPG
jgi:hypothetical protein